MRFVASSLLTIAGLTLANYDDMLKHALVGKHLIQPAIALTDILAQRSKESGGRKELLLFVFDEAANLWVGTKGDLFFRVA